MTDKEAASAALLRVNRVPCGPVAISETVAG
jgi:hypothetical protein